MKVKTYKKNGIKRPDLVSLHKCVVQPKQVINTNKITLVDQPLVHPNKQTAVMRTIQHTRVWERNQIAKERWFENIWTTNQSSKNWRMDIPSTQNETKNQTPYNAASRTLFWVQQSQSNIKMNKISQVTAGPVRRRQNKLWNLMCLTTLKRNKRITSQKHWPRMRNPTRNYSSTTRQLNHKNM